MGVDENHRDIMSRVFTYCERGRGSEIAQSEKPDKTEDEFGIDNSDDEPNTLKRWYQKWFHWKWRKWIYVTLTYPETSQLAVWISLFIIGCVLMSSVTFVLETVDELNTPMNSKIFVAVETLAIVVFTVDFGLRVTTCPNLMKFSKDVMNWIDLAAIVPYYVFLMLASSSGDGGQSRIVRVLSLFRMLRLFKLGSRFQNLQVGRRRCCVLLSRFGCYKWIVHAINRLALLLFVCSSLVHVLPHVCFCFAFVLSWHWVHNAACLAAPSGIRY